MNHTLLTDAGGTVLLPSPRPLVSRDDGGHLVVNPPRDVWERSELTESELASWGRLVAVTGRAMLEMLPQLAGGCVNYWEAGNWSLHDDAAPAGPKDVQTHRRVHLHVLGRSRSASHPSWKWGEAPVFPRFADRLAWAEQFEWLTPGECQAVVDRIRALLEARVRATSTDADRSRTRLKL